MFTEDIYPAGYSYVLGVMSSDQSGNLASYSNWDFMNDANCEYEMIAPGSGIYSTIPGNRYADWNGTSMAAPMVSAAAAVIRGYFGDKDEYNSRFIMGQLASATEDKVNFTDKVGYFHSYASLNLYDSMVNLPKPNLKVSEVFALDNVRGGTENDGDRIIDAGETIDLGIAIRNQWGKTGTVTIKADNLSEGAGVASGYVEFIDDEIEFTSIGTYSSANNGFVYEDSLLTDVTNPIRFKIAPNTPNDSEIKINLTVTTTNGLDGNDNKTYTTEGSFTFRVQKGVSVSGHITEDTTWTADKYWIIENSVVIDENATLTVEPGTQIQFWSSDEKDAYTALTMAYIKNDGELHMSGTENAPIEMFPGKGFENFVCEISGDGKETLQYCNVANPYLGNAEMYYSWVDICDHCVFTQNYDGQELFVRRLNSGKVETRETYGDCGFYVLSLTNCIMNYFRGQYWNETSNYNRNIFIVSGRNNLFNKCSVVMYKRDGTDRKGQFFYCNTDLKDSVFLGGDYRADRKNYVGSSVTSLASAPTAYPKQRYILYDDASVSKYVVMEPYNLSNEKQLMRDIATALGGTLACFSDEMERNKLADLLAEKHELAREEGQGGDIYGCYYLGYEYSPGVKGYVWDDNSTYTPSVGGSGAPSKWPYTYFQINSYPTYNHNYVYQTDIDYNNSYAYVLEVPKTMTDEEIKSKLSAFDYAGWFDDNTESYTRHSAILNAVLDTTPDRWTHFTAPTWTDNTRYILSGNYWGTENSTLINKMIIDDDDFAGTLCNIDEKPILTLDDDLSDIYPFVTDITVTEQGGHQSVESCAPGKSYDVHVTYNRDMDRSIQPAITYGGEYPFTDYMVTGNWVSDREWVGTTKISSVSTGGTQIFRAVGGAAEDDTWLVCGTDELRFGFNIDAASAQSMVLNATGGSGKVDLTWFQNDYELLSGFNIYRSTNPDYGYTKIYSALNTETAYSDTDVQDGVTYYYYFKIVDTDGNEVENSQSNTASASPTDRIKPTITHTKVTSATVGRAVSIGAKASDNIGVKSVKLFYKKVGDSSFASTTLTLLNDNYVGTIPASYVTSAGVQYYLEVEDTAGNKNWSGSADVPYTITAGTNAVVNAVFPSTIDYGYDENITVYGVNFRNDSAVDLSGYIVKNFTVNEDGTEIAFTAPSLPVGAYTVYVDNAKLATKLTVRDTASFIQINEGEVSSGKTLKLPVYAGVKGEMTSVHAVITIPTDKFSGASFELANGVNANLQQSYRYGSMTISLSSANNFNPGADKPLGYLVLTPKAVSEETSGQIVVTEGLINDGEANSLSSATVTVYPNFSISAIIRYFFNNKLVSGVTVKADDVSKMTDANGSATLTEIKRSDVVVTASKNEYVDGAVEAFDAVLILKYCAYNNLDDDGKPILTENQILAADVNGDGKVTEADATLILKMAVGLIKKFDAGSWIFVPASQAKTLTAATTNVSFTAIMVGDVDGSWAK